MFDEKRSRDFNDELEEEEPQTDNGPVIDDQNAAKVQDATQIQQIQQIQNNDGNEQNILEAAGVEQAGNVEDVVANPRRKRVHAVD